MAKTSNPTNTPTEADLLAKVDEIDAQLANLAARRILDTRRIVELEKAGETPLVATPAEQALQERLTELLGTSAPKQAANELHDLQLDRVAIDKALPIIHARYVAAHGALVDFRTAARAADWRELVRARVFAIVALRRVNDQVDAFLDGISSGGIRPSLPLYRPAGKLLGGMKTNTSTGAAAFEFIELAVRDGFVTRKEIERNG